MPQKQQGEARLRARLTALAPLVLADERGREEEPEPEV